MDIDALEKLVNLREKGVISEQEFESEKQKLLSNAPAAEVTAPTATKSKGVNWKNCGVAFLISSAVFIACIIIVMLVDPFVEERLITAMFSVFWGIICNIIFLKAKYGDSCFTTSKNSWSMLWFMLGFLLGPIAMWVVTYKLLQSKSDA